MPSAKQSLQSKLSLIAAGRGAAYYDGQTVHALAGTLGSSAAATGKKPVLVISRTCYREIRDSYPVKSAKELRTMLSQRAAASPGVKPLHFIGPWRDSKRSVLTIIINPGHDKTIEQAWLIIPETILVTRLFGAGLKEIQTPGAQLFFYQSDSAKYEHLVYQAALRGGVIQNADSAKLAFGVSEKQSTQQVPWLVYRDLLANGFLALPWSDIRQFVVTRKKTKQPLPLTQMGTAAGVLTGVYFLGASVYLNWIEDSRMSQLDAYGEEVAARLSERSQREGELTRLEALYTQGVAPDLVLASFDLLARFQLDGITLNEFSSNFSVAEVRGETKSATHLVTELNQMPQVQNIEFTSPVRRGQNGEMFSLSIQLNENWRELSPDSDALAVDDVNLGTAGESE